MARYTNGGRGKKEIPSNLNLVPFIDLFSTMIIFLIVTAVFDKLASVQINMGAEDKAAASVPQQPIKKIEATVKITIFKDTVELFDAGKKTVLQKEGEDFSVQALEEFALTMREKYPEKKDVVVSAKDTSIYKDLIVVMDAFLGQSFTEIIVTGSQEG